MSGIGKGKGHVAVNIATLRHEALWGSGGTAPCILNLGMSGQLQAVIALSLGNKVQYQFGLDFLWSTGFGAKKLPCQERRTNG